MTIYTINFSNETQIGGAYDDFHHEIARIVKYEDTVRVEFRSRDYIHELNIIDDNTRDLDFGDGRNIKIRQDGQNIFISINDKEIEVSYPSFSYQDENGKFVYEFEDDYNLILQTASEEIVVPITVGLVLMAYVHNLG